MIDKVKEDIGEQFYGGYCEFADRYGLDWQEAISNADQILDLTVEKECYPCRGKGSVPTGSSGYNGGDMTCINCNGTGKQTFTIREAIEEKLK